MEKPHGYSIPCPMFADAFHWKKDVACRLSDEKNSDSSLNISVPSETDITDQGFIVTFKSGGLFMHVCQPLSI